jgi:hypothetical protein
MVVGERAIAVSDRDVDATERVARVRTPRALDLALGAVGSACLTAAAALGLGLARFDLVLGAEQAVCLEVSELHDLPADGGARGEVVGALCDLLATGR